MYNSNFRTSQFSRAFWIISAHKNILGVKANMNNLFNYAENNQHNLLNKYKHYFSIYDRHFSKFRNTEVNIVEFGVAHGGSLQMWKNYFGHKAKIYGIDIDPNCKQLEEDRISILIGDQGDKIFLRSLKKNIPRIDILIDDGGHEMEQQITTFEELFPHISSNGVYLCEDLHTSYMNKFGGGYKRKNTFVEYSKNIIDQINAWFSEEPESFRVTDLTRTVYSLHYYNSVLVIEKKPVQKGGVWISGKPRIPSLLTSALECLESNQSLKSNILELEEIPHRERNDRLNLMKSSFTDHLSSTTIDGLLRLLEDEEAFLQILKVIKATA